MSWKRKPPDCAELEPLLVAYVCGEPHPRIPGLVAHLLVCEECRREEAELRAVEAAVGRALASPRAALAVERARGCAPSVRGRLSWLATHATPAAAMTLIAAVLLLGRRTDSDLHVDSPRAASIFGEPAAAAGRSFDGAELDRRLDWIAFRLKGLEGDPW